MGSPGQAGQENAPGTRIALGDGTEIMAGERLEEGVRIIYFPPGTDVMSLLGRLGRLHCPVYHQILRPFLLSDGICKNDGSAAPTASLHFTAPDAGKAAWNENRGPDCMAYPP